MSILTSIVSPRLAARNRVERLAAAMIDAVDSRLQEASSPVASMKLFNGIGAGYTGSTFVANANNWLHDLRTQLNGFHMGAGTWKQSYGLIPLSDRFLLSCGHNGPGIGESIKYVKEDGTVFSTTLSRWINDYGTVDAQADLSVYVTASALPAWVYRAPIIDFPALLRSKLSAYNPPTVGITQGNWIDGPATPYGLHDTPHNRMTSVSNLNGVEPGTDVRAPFFNFGRVGGSGTPRYVLLENTLYLFAVVLSSGGGGLFVCDHISYINSMIARGATSAGISPVTISLTPSPI